ncbi:MULTISPECIES: hypothetical protein [unclassified Solwaraspora]|uniref:hypothetical protein n=1 Tax=unclassified Solwaraspora TaxID=2627926 RepID=UPI00248AEEF8|nr:MULTISPECIES: hypothetical protein [unclassified Solwaraspora]WBB97904.1 hypothetical protein O7553_02765 [Solwaraspora sp. WMMA2059]WBC23537.1 hypothetical protein O7543_14585 [Solwaraspora sp. WMMA2080]WJK34379.1 hypothetical protein O7610_27870 [Solwaraspora sp. WMMA2065]
MTVLGVALIASGLTVLLVMRRTLWPARAATVGSRRAGSLDAAPHRRRRGRGRRRATRTGLFRRRATPGGRHTVGVTVPRQRRGGRPAVVLPEPSVAAVPPVVVPSVAAVPPAAAPPAAAPPAAADEDFDWFDRPTDAYAQPVRASDRAVPASDSAVPAMDPPVAVPVVGTTVTGHPFRGVAPVPQRRDHW